MPSRFLTMATSTSRTFTSPIFPHYTCRGIDREDGTEREIPDCATTSPAFLSRRLPEPRSAPAGPVSRSPDNAAHSADDQAADLAWRRRS